MAVQVLPLHERASVLAQQTPDHLLQVTNKGAYQRQGRVQDVKPPPPSPKLRESSTLWHGKALRARVFQASGERVPLFPGLFTTLQRSHAFVYQSKKYRITS